MIVYFDCYEGVLFCCCEGVCGCHGRHILTEVNFGEANRAYHEHVPASDSSLSTAYILAQLLGTRTNLEKASSLSSDLSLGTVSSIIGANKIASILKSHETSRKVLERFTEWVVNDSRAISQAVETRQRSFADVLALVHQAQKFKEWLKKQDQSSDLCKEYCRAVSRLDWADKLPTKSLRWLLVNGAGLAAGPAGPLVGAAAGVGLSAADVFLLDKLVRGWGPNHFVEGPLKEFIKVE